MKQRLVASAPIPANAPDNLSQPSEDIVDLNFKVNSAFHREFKITAVSRGMTMKELMEASFKAWKDKFGDKGTQVGDLFRG